jgi:hypothetical protein
MWDFYIEGIAKGQENAYAAAKKAGYEEATSRQITVRSWFLERKDALRRKQMFSKAERNLDRALDTEYEDEDGNIKSDVMRIVVDVSKTVATTLGKDHYSPRTEITGKEGGPIEFKDKDDAELAKIAGLKE